MASKIDPKEIKVDFGEIKNDKMRNFRERIWFIKYWAEFMKRNSDDVWSKGQKNLIDSQFEAARKFYEDLGKTEEGRRILKRLIENKAKQETRF